MPITTDCIKYGERQPALEALVRRCLNTLFWFATDIDEEEESALRSEKFELMAALWLVSKAALAYYHKILQPHVFERGSSVLRFLAEEEEEQKKGDSQPLTYQMLLKAALAKTEEKKNSTK